MIKRFLLNLLLLFFYLNLLAQQRDSSIRASGDSITHVIKKDKSSPPTARRDTLQAKPDTMMAVAPPVSRSYRKIVDSFLYANKMTGVQQPPINFTISENDTHGKEFLFYSLCTVLLILGLFKAFYPGYYHNLFRVFFNTSIRQNQLTDQLLQSTLPSLILNIFFTISIGFYLWLIFKNYHSPKHINSELLLPVCIGGAGALYFVKYSVLKFVGWMSEMSEATDSYIFVIFLVNKITGIVLLPFDVLLAFSKAPWTTYITLFSVLIIGLLFLSRYLKAFSFLEYRFPMRPLHFLMYVLAVEVLPILILYKILADYYIV